MVFSHTSLALWRLCKRRWFYRYMLNQKEPKTPAMAYSTWLVHTPIETWVTDEQVGWPMLWESWWANFLAEWNGPKDFDDKLLTLRNAQRMLQIYKESPVDGIVQNVEQKAAYTFPNGSQYQSKPDFVVQLNDRRYTVDIKLKTSNWPNTKHPWPIDPLSPFDDQLLGQAIAHGTDGFVRVTFQGDRKSGTVVGPVIEEKLVDAALKREWIADTQAEIDEIERWRAGTSWPKNDHSCKAFGRPCYKLQSCKDGFQDHANV